jgi:ABC-type proline/glycine betaine transport system permease subunit
MSLVGIDCVQMFLLHILPVGLTHYPSLFACHISMLFLTEDNTFAGTEQVRIQVRRLSGFVEFSVLIYVVIVPLQEITFEEVAMLSKDMA